MGRGPRAIIGNLRRRGADDPAPTFEQGFHWTVDRLLRFRGRTYIDGWAFHETALITEIAYRSDASAQLALQGYGLESDDVAAAFGERARGCRFTFEIQEPEFTDPSACRLGFGFGGGEHIEIADLSRPNLASDPYHALLRTFAEQMHARNARRVLELGARARSGSAKDDFLPAGCELVGLDIVDGPGVDVVGDAHQLSKHFPPESFDGCYSISTFEHLAMPWKAALELNAVMKTGGLVFIATHQSWPVHDAPWDFFRFSDNAWTSLFNPATGFEVVETAMGLRGSLVADDVSRETLGLDREPCFLGSAVIVRKTGPSALRWGVELDEITPSAYPA
jgi:Methyltransferase domain